MNCVLSNSSSSIYQPIDSDTTTQSKSKKVGTVIQKGFSYVSHAVSKVTSISKLSNIASKIIKFIQLVFGEDTFPVLNLVKIPVKAVKNITSTLKVADKAKGLMELNKQSSLLRIAHKVLSFVTSILKTVKFFISLGILNLGKVAATIGKIPVFGIVSKLPFGIVVNVFQFVVSVLGAIEDAVDFFKIGKKLEADKTTLDNWGQRSREVENILSFLKDEAKLEELKLKTAQRQQEADFVEKSEKDHVQLKQVVVANLPMMENREKSLLGASAIADIKQEAEERSEEQLYPAYKEKLTPFHPSLYDKSLSVENLPPFHPSLYDKPLEEKNLDELNQFHPSLYDKSLEVKNHDVMVRYANDQLVGTAASHFEEGYNRGVPHWLKSDSDLLKGFSNPKVDVDGKHANFRFDKDENEGKVLFDINSLHDPDLKKFTNISNPQYVINLVKEQSDFEKQRQVKVNPAVVNDEQDKVKPIVNDEPAKVEPAVVNAKQISIEPEVIIAQNDQVVPLVLNGPQNQIKPVEDLVPLLPKDRIGAKVPVNVIEEDQANVASLPNLNSPGGHPFIAVQEDENVVQKIKPMGSQLAQIDIPVASLPNMEDVVHEKPQVVGNVNPLDLRDYSIKLPVDNLSSELGKQGTEDLKPTEDVKVPPNSTLPQEIKVPDVFVKTRPVGFEDVVLVQQRELLQEKVERQREAVTKTREVFCKSYRLSIARARTQINKLDLNKKTDQEKLIKLNAKIIKWEEVIQAVNGNRIDLLEKIQGDYKHAIDEKITDREILKKARVQKIFSFIYRIAKVVIAVSSVFLFFTGFGTIPVLAAFIVLNVLTYSFGIFKFFWKETHPLTKSKPKNLVEKKLVNQVEQKQLVKKKAKLSASGFFKPKNPKYRGNRANLLPHDKIRA